MKRIAFLFVVLFSIGVITSFGLGVCGNTPNSFEITKGYVKANKNFYKSCSFNIVSIGEDAIVEQVLVNGAPARVRARRTHHGVQYIVKLPGWMKLHVGTSFEVQITITDPNGGLIMMNSAASSARIMECIEGGEDIVDLAIPGGPGGPGGGGDPTVVVIKYP